MIQDVPTRSPLREAPVTVVLLADDLVHGLREPVERWQAFVRTASPGSQILVVQDAGGNDVPSGIDGPPIRVAHHIHPRGLGGCLETGLRLVDTPLALILRCDLQFDPAEVGKLFDAIDQVDLAVACRSVGPIPGLVRIRDQLASWIARIMLGYSPDPRAGWPGWRGCGRRWLARHVFGVPLSDPESGLWLARTDAIRGLPVQSRDSFAWIEMLAKVNHLGALLAEVGVRADAARAIDGSRTFAGEAWRVFVDPDFGPPRVNPMAER